MSHTLTSYYVRTRIPNIELQYSQIADSQSKVNDNVELKYHSQEVQ